jgi:hypothetical protein
MEPATKKAKTDSRARPYCGTWNNYTEEDRIRLLDYVNQPGGPTYILVGREVGKETHGTLPRPQPQEFIHGQPPLLLLLQ